MELNVLQVFIGLVVAAGCGFLIAWLIRSQALSKSAIYATSLEQLLAGTMRDRETAIERERSRASEARLTQQGQSQRITELEKELEHREMQVITYRDEAIQLARTREELSQRLARQEQLSQEVESRLTARIRELKQQGGGLSGGYRIPGSRGTGPERELAALVAAHETDLAQLEARYLDVVRAREAEVESMRKRLQEAEAAAVNLAAPATGLTRARRRIARLETGKKSATQPEPAQPAESAPTELDAGSNGAGTKATGKRRSQRPRHGEEDDLKRIAGVDAAVEQALLLLGVTSFRQVARWKDKDIERMARKLYQPPERIRSEGWVESARQEHSQKYGQDP
jgi:predicted flap endonuclease-1-like 5' DNA nuclease